jgi:hypothetical protein
MLISSHSPPITGFFSSAQSPKTTKVPKAKQKSPVKTVSKNHAQKPNTKGKGKRLTDAERLAIIKQCSNGSNVNKTKIAKKYEVSATAIRNLLKNPLPVIDRNSTNPQASRQRFTPPKFPQLEEQLMDWITALRNTNVPVTPSLIMLKAKELAHKLAIVNFSASNGWYQGFSNRHSLSTIHLCGEGGEVDKTDPSLLAKLNELYDIIHTYDPSNVYNMDETGLFFRMIPRFTVLLKNEDPSSTRGTKEAKERVTITVCSNATGSHKLPLFMIGKPENPTCLRYHSNKWPLHYSSQKKAWQDQRTFDHWFRNIFAAEVRKRTGMPVLLIVDNATSHTPSITHNGVRIVFLPPNVTSWKQPMDQGIIAAFKKHYKYNLLKEVIDFYENTEEEVARLRDEANKLRSGGAGLMYGRPAHLIDAARIAVKSWDSVTATSITNCFKKADIIKSWKKNTESTDEDTVPTDDSTLELNDLISNMIAMKLLSNDDVSSFKEEMDAILHHDDEYDEEMIASILEAVDSEIANSHPQVSFDDAFVDSMPMSIPKVDLDLKIKSVLAKASEFEDELVKLMQLSLDDAYLDCISTQRESIYLFKKSLVRLERSKNIHSKNEKKIQLSIGDWFNSKKDETSKTSVQRPLDSDISTSKQDDSGDMMDVDGTKVNIHPHLYTFSKLGCIA